MNYEDFIVSITLDASYNKKNILHILQNGKNCNMTYYKEDDKGYRTVISNLNESFDYILKNDSNSILSSTQNTFLSLFFLDDSGILKVMISPAAFCHIPFTTKNDICCEPYFDVAQYVKKALLLCNDFKILNVLAEYIS